MFSAPNWWQIELHLYNYMHTFNKVLETFLSRFWSINITQLLQIYQLHIYDVLLHPKSALLV